MVYFPNGDEEIELIKFVARYQYLHVRDSKYFFSSSRYYRNRIKNLIAKKFIKKVNSFLVLDEIGIEYVKLFGFQYNKRNRNKKYIQRLFYLSNIGAFYNSCNLVKFKPSFEIKDKEIFTITGRRFIGVLEINGIDYLSYYISKEHDTKYITSVLYDIEKETKNKNIIVFIDDVNRININNFACGMNQILLIEDCEVNREKLKYINSIKWSEILKDTYKTKMFISEYNFCDYTDYKNKYIATFYFLDTEKVIRIQYFLRENKNKMIDIICPQELEQQIRKEIPNACYKIVDVDKKYIIKERNVYD